MFKQNAGSRPQKGSPEAYALRVRQARSALLLTLIMTVVNIALLFLDTDSYFLYSIALPFYGVVLGQAGGFLTLALLVAAVILAVYLLLWWCSKKKPVLLWVAGILFAVDTVLLLALGIFTGAFVSALLDLLFHILVLVELFLGVRASGKLRAMDGRLVTNPDLSGSAECLGHGPEIDPKHERMDGPEIK